MSELAEEFTGKFIVIDGGDGAGKSTHLHLLAEYLCTGGVEITETRDPGGTVIGDKIRDILLDRSHEQMEIACEILLYMASRTQLMHEVIAPAIERGDCVLCDRWVSSTIAYQLASGAASEEDILSIYELTLRSTRPDLTVILDVPAEVGLGRLAGGPDRMEARPLEFHKKVRDLFLTQAQAMPKLFAVLDAAGSVEEVQQNLRALVAKWDFKK